MNVLLSKFTNKHNTAPFSQIKIEDYVPAFQEGIALAKAEIEIAKSSEFDVVLKNYDLEIAKNDAYKLVFDYLKMI